MNIFYLAVDIGASSGRHIVGWMENGRMRTKEVYRFENGCFRSEQTGLLVWDAERLTNEVIKGIDQCRRAGLTPSYMGIDTWGVDYLLLDGEDQPIGEAVAYRDSRTVGMDRETDQVLSSGELYARTGIQKQDFNTVYQLMAEKKYTPQRLASANSLLFMPDYLHFRLTGVKASEYTIATTSGLVTPATGGWDWMLIEKLGLPKEIFQPILPAGSVLGPLKPEIAESVGCSPLVVLPAAHDTASAVLSVWEERAIYLSSGTWSLIGVERPEADLSEHACTCNFTNEGGFARRYRFLKNIMGLWMLQSVKRESGMDYEAIRQAAESCLNTPFRVDVNDKAFFAPESMVSAVRKACGKPTLPLPEVCAVIYQSLADDYAEAVAELEHITGDRYDTLQIVGGGSRDRLLNRLCASRCGKTVYAGPNEATAIGNLTAQMIGTGNFASVKEAREMLKHSFEAVHYSFDM